MKPIVDTISGYMTKYALTQGIVKVNVRPSEGGYQYTVGEPGYPVQLKEGTNFFRRKEDAEKAAKDMAKKKIASLQKSLAKLKKLAKEPKWFRDDR